MKSAPFIYRRAGGVAEAVELLDHFNGEARILAGGQSLVPMMHMRLMQPEAVIDINGISELEGINATGRETVIGALTRYSHMEYSPIIAERLPLLQEAIGHIGDRQVRNRGTIGGSLSQADPLGEMALVCLALDATVVATGPHGDRLIRMAEFIEGPYATALEPTELLRSVHFPPSPSAYVFVEVSRRHNDYAVIACAVAASKTEDGIWEDVRIAMIGVDDHPVLIAEAASAVDGTSLEDACIAVAVSNCREVIDPPSDVRGSAEYRRHLAGVHLARSLRRLRGAEEDHGGR